MNTQSLAPLLTPALIICSMLPFLHAQLQPPPPLPNQQRQPPPINPLHVNPNQPLPHQFGGQQPNQPAGQRPQPINPLQVNPAQQQLQPPNQFGQHMGQQQMQHSAPINPLQVNTAQGGNPPPSQGFLPHQQQQQTHYRNGYNPYGQQQQQNSIGQGPPTRMNGLPSSLVGNKNNPGDPPAAPHQFQPTGNQFNTAIYQQRSRQWGQIRQKGFLSNPQRTVSLLCCDGLQ